MRRWTSIRQRIHRALVCNDALRKAWRRRRPTLSIVLIVHNMQREASRTLHSLSTEYQENIAQEDYEVIVVENGSSAPLDPRGIRAFGDKFSYHHLHNPPPSPAHAINYGVEQAKSDNVCIMIDGACLVTPGVICNALKVFRVFPNPVIITRYFYLGPGSQNDTTHDGYDSQVEDALLKQIGWPQTGYRLFEIGTPLRLSKDKPPNWFQRPLESNCLFLRKSTFNQIGGCDERFDIPGGGLASFDLLRRLTEFPNTEIVKLVGEGTFHQIHGGTTTNTSAEDRDAKVDQYKQQYEEIRGYKVGPPRPAKRLHFFGRMRNAAAANLKHRIGDGMRLAANS